MIKVESLKSYIDILSNDDFMNLSKRIYSFSNSISEDYPDYKEWFFDKQIPRLYTSEGDILFVKLEGNVNKIIAMTCLKRTSEECKICTIYVSEEYRNQHIGTILIENSMIFLGTNKPFITFADYKLPLFKSIIDKFDWELVEIVPNAYNNETSELCFNGKLIKNNDFEKQTFKCIRTKK